MKVPFCKNWICNSWSDEREHVTRTALTNSSIWGKEENDCVVNNDNWGIYDNIDDKQGTKAEQVNSSRWTLRRSLYKSHIVPQVICWSSFSHNNNEDKSV